MRPNSSRGTATSAMEDRVSAVAPDLGPDLDHLLAQAGERPLVPLAGQRQRAQEVRQVVGQRMKLEAHRYDVLLPLAGPVIAELHNSSNGPRGPCCEPPSGG